MLTRRRRTLLVDQFVQRDLTVRVITYWALYAAANFCLLVGIPMFMSRINQEAPQSPFDLARSTFHTFWPVFGTSLLLTPLVIRDMMLISNRFAGPIIRLKRALHDLAEGKRVAPIRFRDDDYWHDVGEEFNRLLLKIRQAQQLPGTEDLENPTPEFTEDDSARL